jgi:hypothetical protein
MCVKLQKISVENVCTFGAYISTTVVEDALNGDYFPQITVVLVLEIL